MYIIGEEEIQAVAKTIRSKKLFRYDGGHCSRFETAWASKVGAGYAKLCNSGTNALISGLVGMGVGPGQEVIVPAYTYMATPMAVVAVGAVPVIAEIDESMTLCPKDTEAKITRYTGAIIPVHMNGLSCDMKRLGRVSRKHKVPILEDCCQAVGGSFEGRRLGSFGKAGAFSFNYFKNISAGEGGAIVTSDRNVFRRATNMIDACAYYWDKDVDGKASEHFCGPNFRYTEIQAAILRVQLKRLDGILRACRKEKKAILKSCDGQHGLRSIVNHSLADQCGTCVGFLFDSERLALAMRDALTTRQVSSFRPLDTGRHVYTAWDPILRRKGGHHPALDTFKLPANRKLKPKYSVNMCKASLKLFARTLLMPTSPETTAPQLARKIASILKTATQVLG
jgi:dTDP-4-amino-4,6-dideoxygalactose transaminase